jgi:hypothetical protein
MYEGTFSSTIEDYKKNKNRVFEKTAQQKIQEMNTIFTNTQNKLDQILREVQDDAVINNITNNNIVNNTSNITNTTNRTEAPRENKGQTQIKKKDEVTKKIDQVNFIVEQDPIETDFKLLQEILKSNKEKFEKEKKKVVKNSLDNLADVGTSSKKGNNDIITDFDIKKINFIDLPEVANKLNLDTNINKITPKFLKP